MEEQCLAFIDKIGTTVNGENIYRFDFTQAPEIVWGDSWNVVPCSIIPNLLPDPNTLSLTSKLITNLVFNLAKYNSCFSMQDCIDGIIALCFTNPRDKEELVLKFGEPMDEVIAKLGSLNLELSEIKEITQEADEKIIEQTMKALENSDDGLPFDE